MPTPRKRSQRPAGAAQKSVRAVSKRASVRQAAAATSAAAMRRAAAAKKAALAAPSAAAIRRVAAQRDPGRASVTAASDPHTSAATDGEGVPRERSTATPASTSPASTGPTPADRLRRSVLRPTRSQLVVASLLAVLAFLTVTQMRTIGADDTYSGLRQQDLVQALDGLSAASRRAESDVEALERTRNDLEDSSQRREIALAQARKEAETLGILSGTLAARGPGIRVTVTDPDRRLSQNSLLDGVQELRDARAEALEINDRIRVVAQTSFAADPEGIRVDGVLLEPPFVIDAIGNPETLKVALEFRDGFIDDVEGDGASVKVQLRKRVDIKVTRDPLETEYAEPDDSK